MNLKKKLKRFFSLTRKADGGFTLVELIVVIAIIAILSGIAVPAYSGYVEKANKSADEQLLASLNTAFAAACVINGEDNYGRNDVTVSLNNGVADVDVAGIDNFETDFGTYFEGGTFKVFTKLFYNKNIGGFAVDEVLTYSFGGNTITLSSKDVAVLSGDNAFSDRGSAALLNDIGVLETYLAGGYIGEDILEAIGKSDDFFFALGGYLGLKQEDYEDTNAYKEAVGTELEILEKENANASTNALIMYAASNAANASEEQIGKLFTGSVTSNIEVKNADGNRNNEATMANAALAYGMYTAYLQQNPDVDATTSDGSFTNVVNSTAFATYYNSPEGQADLEAYMAAMNMVSDNTSNSAITSDILKNGIVGNDALANLMKDVMGN